VDGDEVVMDVLAGERQLGNRFDDNVGAARGGVADNHAGGKQGEVDELASVDREVLDLLLTDHGIGRGFRRLNQRGVGRDFDVNVGALGMNLKIKDGCASDFKMDFERHSTEAGGFGG